jgi:secondary thiamine-phosphate synthase enzyme
MIFQKSLTIATSGRGTREITSEVQSIVGESGIDQGLCQIFIHHTSASLMLCENADPDVRVDLETFMARIAPDNDPDFIHVAEGPDDMPAHIRSVITQTGLTIPVVNGQIDLGTWQGIYLWEHRVRPHQRRITLSAFS